MEENEAFLKYLIDEEIYLIEDKSTVEGSMDQGSVDDKKSIEYSEKEDGQTPDEKTRIAEGAEENGVTDKSGDLSDAAGANNKVKKDAAVGSIGSMDKDDASGSNGSVDKDDAAGAIDSVEKDDTARSIGSQEKDDTGGSNDSTDIDSPAGTGGLPEGENISDINKSDDEKAIKKYKDTTILLLDYADQISMPGEHKDLLAKILQSVDLDLDSVEMIFQDEFSNLGVKSFLNCPVIAFIPLIPKHISALFAAEKYMINIINGNQFVACDALNELNQNRSLKRNLWEQLKLIYGI